MIMTEKEFGVLCKQNGFQKMAPNFYCRCYGDGLYQMIYSGFKKHYDGQAIMKNPSLANQQSRYITIAVRSLFTRWEPNTFVVGRDCGEFNPGNMYPEVHSQTYVFSGIEEDYRIMEAYGFSMLNSISTQKDYLEFYCKSRRDKNSFRIHNEALVEPYLISHNYYEASVEIAIALARRVIYLEDLHSNLLRAGKMDQYERLYNRTIQRLNINKDLLRAISGKNYVFLCDYLESSFQCNMEEIRRNNICIHQDFQKAIISLP